MTIHKGARRANEHSLISLVEAKPTFQESVCGGGKLKMLHASEKHFHFRRISTKSVLITL